MDGRLTDPRHQNDSGKQVKEAIVRTSCRGAKDNRGKDRQVLNAVHVGPSWPADTSHRPGAGQPAIRKSSPVP